MLLLQSRCNLRGISRYGILSVMFIAGVAPGDLLADITERLHTLQKMDTGKR